MPDSDLQRNRNRFPKDFMFQLNKKDLQNPPVVVAVVTTSKFRAVFATLREMLATRIPRKRQIGFHSRARQI